MFLKTSVFFDFLLNQNVLFSDSERGKADEHAHISNIAPKIQEL